MTLFLACFFALLAALFGFGCWMYFGAVEALLDELTLLDEENDVLVGHIVSQQEAMDNERSQLKVQAKVFRADGSVEHLR